LSSKGSLQRNVEEGASHLHKGRKKRKQLPAGKKVGKKCLKMYINKGARRGASWGRTKREDTQGGRGNKKKEGKGEMPEQKKHIKVGIRGGGRCYGAQAHTTENSEGGRRHKKEMKRPNRGIPPSGTGGTKGKR